MRAVKKSSLELSLTRLSSKILYLLAAIAVISFGMLDARRIMKLFGLGGSPTTPQSAPGRLQKQRPVTQYYTPRYDELFPTSFFSLAHTFSNSDLKPPLPDVSNDGTKDDYPPLTAPVIPVGASIAPFRTTKPAPILFYDKNDPFYEFTNFSPHDVTFKGKRYPTCEHLFQAFKVRVELILCPWTDVGYCTLTSLPYVSS